MQYNPYTPAASKKCETLRRKSKNIFMMNYAKKTKHTRIGVLEFLFDFLPALAGLLLPDRPAGDLPGA